MNRETDNPSALPPDAAAPGPTEADGDPGLAVPPEVLPDYDKLVIEDGEPAESWFAEKQYRLLTEPLYASWPGPGGGRPFQVMANVGLFVSPNRPAVAPDVMLSLDIRPGDFRRREHNSYFTWVVEKPPDVVIELVSDRRGGEDAYKLGYYARAGVPIYAIFDPEERLGRGVLRTFGLHEGIYEARDSNWFPTVNLGLTLWEGLYEERQDRWLRWCERDGRPIPTAAEQIALERRRADEEKRKREQLEALLRQHGIETPA
jgi:hypothetical protein